MIQVELSGWTMKGRGCCVRRVAAGLAGRSISCYDPRPPGAEQAGAFEQSPGKQLETGSGVLNGDGVMTNGRALIWMRRIVLIVAAGIGLQQLWHHGHDYIFPAKLVTVEPGKIYRGAWQKPWPMRAIVHDHKIKTVLALAHPSDHPLVIAERQLAEELGVKWVHIPIVDQRGTGDLAAEDAISDLLEQAASVLADPANYPVFFHCHHGLNRTSMVQIAYRTKYCGWTLEQAADEIERTVGLVKVNHGPDYRHMVSFYEKRVLPLRSHAKKSTPAAAMAAKEQAGTAAK
jgi:protein tyrosine phosphatase (PTP) superfamily phosphohydrolase (DUF442 family)